MSTSPKFPVGTYLMLNSATSDCGDFGTRWAPPGIVEITGHLNLDPDAGLQNEVCTLGALIGGVWSDDELIEAGVTVLDPQDPRVIQAKVMHDFALQASDILYEGDVDETLKLVTISRELADKILAATPANLKECTDNLFDDGVQDGITVSLHYLVAHAIMGTAGFFERFQYLSGATAALSALEEIIPGDEAGEILIRNPIAFTVALRSVDCSDGASEGDPRLLMALSQMRDSIKIGKDDNVPYCDTLYYTVDPDKVVALRDIVKELGLVSNAPADFISPMH